MKTRLDEISERIERIRDERSQQRIQLCDILKDLVEEVKRVDQKYGSRTDDLRLYNP